MSYISINLDDAEKRIVYEIINNPEYFGKVINKIAYSLTDSFMNSFDLDALSDDKIKDLSIFIKNTAISMLGDLTIDIIKNNEEIFDNIYKVMSKSMLDEEFKKAKEKGANNE